MKKISCLILFVIGFAVAIFGIITINRFNTAVDYKNLTGETVVISITDGETPAQVRQALIDNGVIKDEDIVFGFTAYRIYQYLTGFDKGIKAGSYQFEKGSSIRDIAQKLQKSEVDDVKVTIKEGLRIEEVADVLNLSLNTSDNKKSKFNKNEFIDTAKNFVSDKEYLKTRPAGNNSLEGYLFPDTYFLPSDATAKDVINIMLDNFNEKIYKPYSSAIQNNKYSLHQLATLASILQREVQTKDDMAMVADIYFKRIRDGWKLEADATTQYALGYSQIEGVWWKKDLTIDDLNVNSPYNTRKFTGLPPGPISGFSVAAFDAIMNPKANLYYFYISDKDCITRYAKTEAEHEANIRKYGTCG